MQILITGANGFVGSALSRELQDRQIETIAAVRDSSRPCPVADQVAFVGEIGPDTDWTAALNKIDVVVHLAGRAHIMKETACDPAAEFHRVNVLGSARLAASAAVSGVKRLVYVSSIKVNGESSEAVGRITERQAPHPCDDYGKSKWEAERSLLTITAGTGLEVVIVRPPLVYGPGVRGNFRQLMTYVLRQYPLPIAGARNARSLIGVGNLSSFLVRCATHPSAAGQTFLLSDGEDVSTPDLYRRLAHAGGKVARLFDVPDVLLRAAALLTGNTGAYERLFGSLVVDSSKARSMLEWTPPHSLDQGLEETVRWFMNRSAGNPSECLCS